MSEQPTSEERRITIQSMSCAGDNLHLFLSGHGEMYISHENDDGVHGAYFEREQQIRLRDWLNKVIA